MRVERPTDRQTDRQTDVENLIAIFHIVSALKNR